jgi:NAD(P)-dependent dehydrogenase (short-subunit alcohol dehydrogenase family)
MNELDGRTAVVIGVGGVGRGIARRLSAEGVRVALADIQPEVAPAVAGEITDAGGVAAAFRVDATDRGSLEELAERVAAELDGPHLLVNTVAAITDRPLDRCTEDDWAWIIESNLLSMVRSVDVMLPYLRAGGQGGHIVLTSSAAGLVTVPAEQLRGGLHNGLYSTTKHALVGYAEMLRHELAPEGISVSLLCPGVVEGNLRSTAARLRPSRYGGPEPDPQVGMEPKRDPMPADEVGRLVVRAVRAGEFWVFTHPDTLALVTARYEDQRRAFAFLAADRSGE